MITEAHGVYQHYPPIPTPKIYLAFQLQLSSKCQPIIKRPFCWVRLSWTVQANEGAIRDWSYTYRQHALPPNVNPWQTQLPSHAEEAVRGIRVWFTHSQENSGEMSLSKWSWFIPLFQTCMHVSVRACSAAIWYAWVVKLKPSLSRQAAEGVTFISPDTHTTRTMGDEIQSKLMAQGQCRAHVHLQAVVKVRSLCWPHYSHTHIGLSAYAVNWPKPLPPKKIFFLCNCCQVGKALQNPIQHNEAFLWTLEIMFPFPV